MKFWNCVCVCERERERHGCFEVLTFFVLFLFIKRLTRNHKMCSTNENFCSALWREWKMVTKDSYIMMDSIILFLKLAELYGNFAIFVFLRFNWYQLVSDINHCLCFRPSKQLKMALILAWLKSSSCKIYISPWCRYRLWELVRNFAKDRW